MPYGSTYYDADEAYYAGLSTGGYHLSHGPKGSYRSQTSTRSRRHGHTDVGPSFATSSRSHRVGGSSRDLYGRNFGQSTSRATFDQRSRNGFTGEYSTLNRSNHVRLPRDFAPTYGRDLSTLSGDIQGTIQRRLSPIHRHDSVHDFSRGGGLHRSRPRERSLSGYPSSRRLKDHAEDLRTRAQDAPSNRDYTAHAYGSLDTRRADRQPRYQEVVPELRHGSSHRALFEDYSNRSASRTLPNRESSGYDGYDGYGYR